MMRGRVSQNERVIWPIATLPTVALSLGLQRASGSYQ